MSYAVSITGAVSRSRSCASPSRIRAAATPDGACACSPDLGVGPPAVVGELDRLARTVRQSARAVRLPRGERRVDVWSRSSAGVALGAQPVDGATGG